MKKIFKYLCYCLPLMAAAVGCSEAEGISEFQPDTNKTGNVTLLASIENADSRASLVATGEARWQANDAIKVVCNDGSSEVFNIDGTGETRRALFTGNLEGKAVGQYALYPTSVELSGDNISIDLPSQIAPSPTGSCAFMAGVIDEKNEVVFKQLTAYVTVQINKLASETASIVFTSDKDLSGLHSVTLPEGMESGAAATTGDKSVVMTFTEAAPTMVNAFFALPVGNYSHLTATAYNAAGKKLNEIVLGTLIAASRGLLLDYQIEMPAAVPSKPEPIEGTVNVAGIYWALGNLQYDKDCTATAGFNAGWRIAPNQAHFIRCEEKADGDITGLTNFDKYDHFNFGGIAAPFSAAVADAIDNVAAGFNFGGKMYTDQACQAETTDFAAAKYGDIAYWASNGQYRTPSDEDFKTLFEKASVQVATYSLGGTVIKGVYFTDPAWGEDPTLIVEEKALTDEDLKNGLFLPYAGRGYNKESTQFNIYKLGAQCWHRTSVVDVNTAAGACFGVLFAPHYLFTDATKASYFYNTAYGSTGRYSIRPIYLGKGTGVVPTPPTPGPEPEPEPGTDTDPVPTTGTVTVAGVEWAIGNLQFVNGGTGAEGFAAGWSISAGQHYHHYLGQTGNIDITDLTSMAHFNFGGIENPCINDATMCASIAGSKDISGKMYTDQTCVNETTDFSAAKFGDIAYWASNGKYRMPTGEEMQKLYTDACRTKASYTTAEGVEVLGTYYYDPASGETPGAVEADAPRVLKNADMKKGLFLPYTGRFYSTALTKLYGINAQGVYRSSTTISASTLEQTYGAIYRPHTLTEKEGKYPADFIYTYWEAKNQSAYGAISLYAIRPVKVK